MHSLVEIYETNLLSPLVHNWTIITTNKRKVLYSVAKKFREGTKQDLIRTGPDIEPLKVFLSFQKIFYKIFYIPRHIESCGTCMKYLFV